MLKYTDSNNAVFKKYRVLYLEFLFELVKNDEARIDERANAYLEEQYPLCSNTSCNKKFTKCKRKCDSCGSKVI